MLTSKKVIRSFCSLESLTVSERIRWAVLSHSMTMSGTYNGIVSYRPGINIIRQVISFGYNRELWFADTELMQFWTDKHGENAVFCLQRLNCGNLRTWARNCQFIFYGQGMIQETLLALKKWLAISYIFLIIFELCYLIIVLSIINLDIFVH